MFQIEWMQQVVKPQSWDKVRLCPEAALPNPAYTFDPATGDPNMPGAAFAHWGPGGQAMQYFDHTWKPGQPPKQLAGSYGFNGYCLRMDAGGNTNTLLNEAGGGNQALGRKRIWVPPLRYSAEIPIIYDATWPNGWPKMTDPLPNPLNLYAPAGAPAMNIGNDWTRVLIARHRMAINVGFMDGHCTTVELPDVFKLKWHGPAFGPDAWKPPPDIGASPTMPEIRAKIRQAFKG